MQLSSNNNTVVIINYVMRCTVMVSQPPDRRYEKGGVIISSGLQVQAVPVVSGLRLDASNYGFVSIFLNL
jgi:hypothetical protein